MPPDLSPPDQLRFCGFCAFCGPRDPDRAVPTRETRRLRACQGNNFNLACQTSAPCFRAAESWVFRSRLIAVHLCRHVWPHFFDTGGTIGGMGWCHCAVSYLLWLQIRAVMHSGEHLCSLLAGVVFVLGMRPAGAPPVYSTGLPLIGPFLKFADSPVGAIRDAYEKVCTLQVMQRSDRLVGLQPSISASFTCLECFAARNSVHAEHAGAEYHDNAWTQGSHTIFRCS